VKAVVGVLLAASCVLSVFGQMRTALAPFTITISADPPVVKAGHDGLIEVTVTNTSKRRLLIQERNPATDYEFDVRDERGNAVPETDLGRKLKEPPTIPMNSRNSGIYLRPNESTKETFALSDLYDLSHRGEYTIQVSRAVSNKPQDGVVKSNTITVTVTE
jgi:hypothetical protein